LKLKLDSETLRAKLRETGFQGEFLRSSSDIETFDLALGTDCYQAFFKVVSNVDDLNDAWSKAQIQLAEYKNRRRVPRDLFLVLLITDSINEIGEELIREISSDAMVCRKIVLRVPGGNLDGTLQGLPFVGLELSGTNVVPGIKHILSILEAKGYPGEVIDTLTSRLAVDRRLASLVVLPVPDVVPFVTNTDYSLEPRSISSGNRCRLESLSMTDFRGLRIIDHLDLSSNLTIIFGLNGTGKTSLFDALEFALLGEVERLESEAPDDLTKRSPYVNLFSDSAKVELQLKVGGTPITVERTASSGGETALFVDHVRIPFTRTAELIPGVRARVAQELDRLTQQSSALDSQAGELRFELDHQQELLAMAQKRLSRIADVVRSTKQRSAGLRNQLVTMDVGSGPDFLVTIGEIDKKTQSELAELTIQRQQIEKQTVDCRSNRTNLESKLAAGKQRLAQLLRELAQTEDGLAKATAVVRFAGLKPDATAEEVSELLAKSQDRMRNIEKAIQQIAELASISEWLIAREERETLEAQLLQLRAKIDGLADQLSLHQKWHDHLSTLTLSLLDAKSKTENQQLENYEPTINLLYQRLNPHPLFGAIKILIDAAEQSLRINFEVSKNSGFPYESPKFSPMKYFSEAQLNLLALSIFLSHSFQQQWSIFVPLMLDDPVQNMDDLNVNGFIDCLRGFAAVDRQFIISTCDINFYRLMLLKLRCLNRDGQNRFSAYRLEGFSQEGPHVIQDFPIESITLSTPGIT
jgi:recombinational DNA repair ATPase RecF